MTSNFCKHFRSILVNSILVMIFIIGFPFMASGQEFMAEQDIQQEFMSEQKIKLMQDFEINGSPFNNVTETMERSNIDLLSKISEYNQLLDNVSALEKEEMSNLILDVKEYYDQQLLKMSLKAHKKLISSPFENAIGLKKAQSFTLQYNPQREVKVLTSSQDEISTPLFGNPGFDINVLELDIKDEDQLVTLELINTYDKMIYGEDDRLEMWQLEEAEKKQRLTVDNGKVVNVSRAKLVKSTCLLTPKWNLIQLENGNYKLKTKPFIVTAKGIEYSACESKHRDPYEKQPTAGIGSGSGFLVGSDILATAGHCIKKYGLSSPTNTAFVFGFYETKSGDKTQVKTIFTEDQIYFGKEIIYKENDSTKADYAIVQLDRSVKESIATPLEIMRIGTVTEGQQVGVIGYPSGLPVKAAFGETYITDPTTTNYFKANLDSFSGNSGSPVFDKNGIVIGILVKGKQDFIVDIQKGCYRTNPLENEDGSEFATKTTSLAKHIPILIKS
jgi:hypothetical protein